jgi:hypothetical protein
MRRRSNGTHVNLEQAIALLIQNQAAFLVSSREIEEWRRKVDKQFEEIKAILLRHERILNQLPEIIRQKIGFKTK